LIETLMHLEIETFSERRELPLEKSSLESLVVHWLQVEGSGIGM
jgi:hypothetical protein